MKLKFLLATCLLSFCFLAAFSQEQDTIWVPSKTSWTGVVKVDSADKNALYTRAKTWISNSYGSAQKVIDLDDKESGQIIVKGKFEVNGIPLGLGQTMTKYVDHVLHIWMKDGRYKWEIIIPGTMNCPDPRNGWSNDYSWYVERYESGMGHKAAHYVVDNTIRQSKKTEDGLELALKSKGASTPDF
jgi:hypothetical protein